ncbi:MAG: PorV/PorQ family protein [bacterium]
MPFGNLMRTVALSLGLAVAAANGLAAQSRTGTARQPAPGDDVYRIANRGAAFLELGVGARALALGGAYVALAEGATALYWNPAGIADVPGIAASLSYETLYDDSGLTNSFAAFAVPVGAGAAGLAVTYFSSGKIERTTERYPEGGDPTAGQYVEWSGLAIGASYARQITDRLSLGGTLKFAQEGISFARATYFGGDFGVRFRTGLYGITLGAALTNLGSRGRMEGPAVDRTLTPGDDPRLPTQRDIPIQLRPDAVLMPAAIRFGVRTELLGTPYSVFGSGNPEHKLTMLAEMVDAINAPTLPMVAFEYGFRNLFFVRGSKLFRGAAEAENDFTSGLAGGFGVRVPGLGRTLAIDYAYRSVELGSNQSISIEFGF